MSHTLVSVLALTATFFSTTSAAEPITFKSGPSRVQLVELYTSEGCHSCPPAEKWLNKLRADKRLWSSVVPVAFHVDYWDYIGWRDRFAQPEYSQRQRLHRHLGNVQTVYTPGFVVAGAEWREWFRGDKLRNLNSRPGPMTATLNDGKLSVSFKPNKGIQGRLEAVVARLIFDQSTQVKAGENDGKTLNHEFVVAGMQRASMVESDDNSWSAEVALPESAHASRTQAVALWITPAGRQFPIQALGGYLPENIN